MGSRLLRPGNMPLLLECLCFLRIIPVPTLHMLSISVQGSHTLQGTHMRLVSSESFAI
jgi:hypothetical protein